jgi:hypothetical protein
MIAARRLGLLICGGLIAAVLAGCSRGEPAPQAPGVATVTVERLRENGLATTRSRLTVFFDGPVESREGRVPLASHFELRLLQADGTTRRVLVASARRSEQSRREVILEVDYLVTNGSTLVISRRLFDRKASGSIEATVSGGLEPAVAILASRALRPADPSFYDPPVAAEPDPLAEDATAMRERLQAHLGSRGVDAETLADALAIFDAIPERQVPSPKLRAALAGLVGTFAEPALADLLTGQNCTGLPAQRIAFEAPPGDERLFARVTYAASGARVVSIDPALRDERFELLMPLLAHEAVHCDRFDSKVEEVAATAFDTLLFLRLVAADPTLAREQTRLARELRFDALAMLNSGGTWPESIGVLRSPGVSAALPETNAPYPSFGELAAAAYPSVTELRSPTEPLAAAYMTALAAEAGADRGDPFDLRYLDALLGMAVELRELLAVIATFGLEPVE